MQLKRSFLRRNCTTAHLNFATCTREDVVDFKHYIWPVGLSSGSSVLIYPFRHLRSGFFPMLYNICLPVITCAQS